MSPDARLMCGITLVLIPTIVYGGLTILGVLSKGTMGVPAPQNLTPAQVAFYRAGHAHAGVLALLCLFVQIAVDYAVFPQSLAWPVRIGPLQEPCSSPVGSLVLLTCVHCARSSIPVRWWSRQPR